MLLQTAKYVFDFDALMRLGFNSVYTPVEYALCNIVPDLVKAGAARRKPPVVNRIAKADETNNIRVRDCRSAQVDTQECDLILSVRTNHPLLILGHAVWQVPGHPCRQRPAVHMFSLVEPCYPTGEGVFGQLFNCVHPKWAVTGFSFHVVTHHTYHIAVYRPSSNGVWFHPNPVGSKTRPPTRLVTDLGTDVRGALSSEKKHFERLELAN